MDSIPCLILAGGFGKRLAAISAEQPKPMMKIGGRPFLEFLLIQLRNQGFRNVIFCTGYRSEVLEAYFENGWRWHMDIRYSREPHPLGTGGALKLAGKLAQASYCIALNGDSILQADIPALVRFHLARNARATMALAHTDDATRFGRVQTDAEGRVTRFVEKGQDGGGSINGGIYVINREVLEGIPDGQVSIERDVFPSLDCLYAKPFDGFFTDIGVPADYLRLANQPEWLDPCLSLL
jgi:D-glycero-alpha-D-manno-heptose 1-phosphate guanylyltransferase